MAQVSYPIEPGGPERLQISWQGNFQQTTFILDGAILGTFADAKELKAGKTFTLGSGSRLSVRLVSNFIGLPQLELKLDGSPLRTDPGKRLGAAWGVIAAVGGLNILIGIVGAAIPVGFLAEMGIGWASILTGLVYVGLAILVKRQSRPALVGAIALFALDGIATLAHAAKVTGTPPVGALFMRVALMVPMIGGFQAISDAERAARRPRRRPAPPPREKPAAQKPAAKPAARPEVRVQERKVVEARPNIPVAPRMARTASAPVKGWGTDVAAESLRGAAHRCELQESGMKVSYRNLKSLEFVWSDLTSVMVRQLPVDPPWEGQLVLDLGLTGSPSLVRILPGTFVNFQTLAGGASSSRLENMRLLARTIASKRPDLALDEATATFAGGGKVPDRFPSLAAFVEYDSRYA